MAPAADDRATATSTDDRWAAAKKYTSRKTSLSHKSKAPLAKHGPQAIHPSADARIDMNSARISSNATAKADQASGKAPLVDDALLPATASPGPTVAAAPTSALPATTAIVPPEHSRKASLYTDHPGAFWFSTVTTALCLAMLARELVVRRRVRRAKQVATGNRAVIGWSQLRPISRQAVHAKALPFSGHPATFVVHEVLPTAVYAAPDFEWTDAETWRARLEPQPIATPDTFRFHPPAHVRVSVGGPEPIVVHQNPLASSKKRGTGIVLDHCNHVAEASCAVETGATTVESVADAVLDEAAAITPTAKAAIENPADIEPLEKAIGHVSAREFGAASREAAISPPSTAAESVRTTMPAAHESIQVDTPSAIGNDTPALREAPGGARVAAEVDCLAAAKRHLSDGQFKQAIRTLEPLLASSSASGEAWSVAGWAWWRIAKGTTDGVGEAARGAAHAFEQAGKVDAERRDTYNRAIARCHLLRAQHESGETRAACLDDAVSLLEPYAKRMRQDDTRLLIEWASALYERARVAQDGADAWLVRALDAMETFRSTDDIGGERAWLHAHILLALSETRPLRDAGLLHERAVRKLLDDLPRLADDVYDAWLTRLIEAEHAFALRLQGAARVAHLGRARASVLSLLERSGSIFPLLAWIRVLNDWAGGLAGSSAQLKFAEAEALFDRIEAMTSQDAGAVKFARAYCLRLRAQRELGARRLETLGEAESLLHDVDSRDVSSALIALEMAEISLARARLLEGNDARAAFRRAAELAEGAAESSPENASIAVTCALSACVELAGFTPPPTEARAHLRELSARLDALAPGKTGTLRLAAHVQLLDDRPARAVDLCNAAWRAGASPAELTTLWREALSRWARTLRDAQQDSEWAKQHRQMCLALNGL